MARLADAKLRCWLGCLLVVRMGLKSGLALNAPDLRCQLGLALVDVLACLELDRRSAMPSSWPDSAGELLLPACAAELKHAPRVSNSLGLQAWAPCQYSSSCARGRQLVICLT